MYYVYILYSKKWGKFYTGQTQDLGDRFIRHNQGRNSYTRQGRPWRLVYAERFASRSEAISREREIKNMKSRAYILGLIGGYEPG
ncbi:MAG: GIY-YIG nuclease family protein [Balneolaceae bacterium]|jgi:putative endonuclease